MKEPAEVKSSRGGGPFRPLCLLETDEPGARGCEDPFLTGAEPDAGTQPCKVPTVGHRRETLTFVLFGRQALGTRSVAQGQQPPSGTSAPWGREEGRPWSWRGCGTRTASEGPACPDPGLPCEGRVLAGLPALWPVPTLGRPGCTSHASGTLPVSSRGLGHFCLPSALEVFPLPHESTPADRGYVQALFPAMTPWELGCVPVCACVSPCESVC